MLYVADATGIIERIRAPRTMVIKNRSINSTEPIWKISF